MHSHAPIRLDRTDAEPSADLASPTVEVLLKHGLRAGLDLSSRIRRRVLATVKKKARRDPAELLRQIRQILAKYEPLMSQTLSDTLLGSWLAAQTSVVQRMVTLPPAPPSPPPAIVLPMPSDEPLIDFPIIRHAAESLVARQILHPAEFYVRRGQARQQAFTVSRTSNEAVIERIQQALVDDIAQGGTLQEFRDRVAAAVADASPLSPAHIETVYRTNVAAAYSEGQRQVLDHPLVKTEFPYVEYHAVHDARTRPDHAAMERHGIDGSNIFRSDDPVIRKFWPPWSFNCRCAIIPITLEMAAAKGVAEAAEWLRTNVPPVQPAFVKHPPFELQKGWSA